MPVEIQAFFNTKKLKMTNYQIELIVNKYFEILMEKSITEKEVVDFGQKNGTLYIVLKNEKIIEEKIKNFYN
jgi:hypothetical protein